MKTKTLFVGLLALFGAVVAHAQPPLKVVTTVTDLAWMAQQVGGKHVKASSLLEGTENPHYIDAVPAFITETATADMVVSVGLELEIGWLPKIVARTGVAAIQPGGKGFVEAGSAVQLLGKPQGKVDRSMGDVHPGGNPHFWLAPTYLAQSSQAVVDGLIGLRPGAAADLIRNQEAFRNRMKSLREVNLKKFAALGLKGAWLMEYHEEFTYFLSEYGLTSFDSVEEKPGVPPSAGRLARVGIAARKAGVRVLLAADYAPKATLKRFSEISGIPVVSVPTSTARSGKLSGYEQLQNHIVDSLVEVVSASKAE